MSEILKTLWGKIHAWAFPSALTLGVYWLFVYPRSAIGHGWLADTTDAEKAAIFAALTAVLAYILNAFSTPLYRILEGYLLWPRWLQDRGVVRQRARKKALEGASTGSGWRRGLALEKLALYPKRDEQIVPTRFGNAIRSFETYGKTRFNLDSQTLWHELQAVVPKYIQSEIQDARSSVDFFVALIYLSAALGLATLVIAGLEGFEASLLLIGILCFVASFTCHWLAVRATADWSYAVHALVNIGRVKLADSLGLQLPDTLEAEKTMWGLVTHYGFFADAPEGLLLDQFRKKMQDAAPEGLGATNDAGVADDDDDDEDDGT